MNDIALSRRPMAAFVVVGLGWGSFAALVPPIKAQIDASDALYGTLMLVASLAALAAMWLAPLAFRVFGRWAIVLGCLAIAGGFAAAGWTMAPLPFVLAMLFATGGSGVADVLANAEISDAEAQSGKALMNLNHAMYSFAFAGGAVATGGLREIGWVPWQVQLLLLGIIVALCSLMRTPRETAAPDDDVPKHSGPRPLLVWLGGCVVLAAFLSEAATEGWSALHLERSLGAAPAQGALGPALFGVTMGIGRLFGHVLASRVNDLWLMSVACVAAAGGLALAGAAPTLAVAYAGFALAGLGIAVVVPLALALVGRSVPSHLRLAALTRAAALGYAAFFLGPPIMGVVSQAFGLRASFGLVAAFLVCVALFLIPALARQVRAVNALQ